MAAYHLPESLYVAMSVEAAARVLWSRCAISGTSHSSNKAQLGRNLQLGRGRRHLLLPRLRARVKGAVGRMSSRRSASPHLY